MSPAALPFAVSAGDQRRACWHSAPFGDPVVVPYGPLLAAAAHVLTSPRCPRALLAVAARMTSPVIRRCVTANPRTSRRTLARLTLSGCAEAAASPFTPPAALSQAFLSGDVAHSVVQNPACPPNVLAYCVRKDMEWYAADILHYAAAVPSHLVRRAAAYALASPSGQGSDVLLTAAVARDECPADTLALVAAMSNCQPALRAVAAHPSTPEHARSYAALASG